MSIMKKSGWVHTLLRPPTMFYREPLRAFENDLYPGALESRRSSPEMKDTPLVWLS